MNERQAIIKAHIIMAKLLLIFILITFSIKAVVGETPPPAIETAKVTILERSLIPIPRHRNDSLELVPFLLLEIASDSSHIVVTTSLDNYANCKVNDTKTADIEATKDNWTTHRTLLKFYEPTQFKIEAERKPNE